jgi:hypothetical protein
MKFRNQILIAGTRLEIAVSITKHSLGGRPNNRTGVSLEMRLAPRGALQEMGDDARTNRAEAKKNLIATTPYSKFAATLSQQRRRHFLTATKTPLPLCRTFAPEAPLSYRVQRRVTVAAFAGLADTIAALAGPNVARKRKAPEARQKLAQPVRAGSAMAKSAERRRRDTCTGTGAATW